MPKDDKPLVEKLEPHQGSFLVPKDEMSRTFLSVRGSAIEHYAMVEQSLLTLFAHLLGVPKNAAGVVFFRINNARARSEMIDRLLNKKYDNSYNVFWHSLQKQLRPLDEQRNKIVHRIVETTTRIPPKQKSPEDLLHSICLVGANYEDRTPASETIDIDDLYDFILKCHFYAAITLHFALRALMKTKDIPELWPDIFQQPVIYPPPNNHPLFQIFR